MKQISEELLDQAIAILQPRRDKGVISMDEDFVLDDLKTARVTECTTSDAEREMKDLVEEMRKREKKCDRLSAQEMALESGPSVDRTVDRLKAKASAYGHCANMVESAMERIRRER